MTDCTNSELKDLLPQLGQGTLDVADEASVRTHVAACADCRAELALLEAVRSGPVVPTMFFAQVPEDKVAKNRIHFDVSPVDVPQEDEVDRILALGATRADIGQSGEESWTVLADPEGNEFCVLRSLAPGHFSL